MLSLSPEERKALVARLDQDYARALLGEGEQHLGGAWELYARDNQLVPWDVPGWSFVVWLAGRGFGKTRCGAEAVREVAEAGVTPWIRLVGPTAADVRDTMVKGVSGLLACSSPSFMPIYHPSLRELEWPNGVKAKTFSAEEPDRLRGGAYGFDWWDEWMAWQYAEEARNVGLFALRLQSPNWRPCGVITTTPKPEEVLRTVIAQKSTYVIRGSSYDNLANLGTGFKELVLDPYAGTEIGRQEIEAEILSSVAGALFKGSTLSRWRLTPSEIPERGFFTHVWVAVDPPGSKKTECGIVVVGIGEQPKRWASDDSTATGKLHAYILADASISGAAEEWADAVIAAAKFWNANGIVAEKNNGGDMVRATIHNVNSTFPLLLVHASDGKRRRAEPVVAIANGRRLHLCGGFGKLEVQMTTWVEEDATYSPDRLDALVWGVSHGLRLGSLEQESKELPSPVTRHRDEGDAGGSGWEIR